MLAPATSPYPKKLSLLNGGARPNPLPLTGALTVANAITDSTRLAGVQGDGATYPASMAGVWPAATNLHTNGAVATNTTGWGSASGFSIERVTAASVGITPLFGDYVLKVTCTGAGAATICSFGTLTLTAAVHRFSVYLWMPATGWSGTNLRMSDGGTFTSATGTKTVSFAQASTGVWQRASFDITPDAGDLSGNMTFATSGTPAVGETFYICGAQVTQSSIDLPYIETDGGTASRSQGRIQVPVAGLFTASQGWAAVRWRSGWGSLPNAAPGLFVWADGVGTQISLRMSSVTAVQILDSAAGNTSVTIGAITNGSLNTSIAKWIATDIGVSAGGNFTMLGSRSSIPSIANSMADIGSAESASAGRPLTGDILWAAAGKGTLTDADAVLFNSWGNNDPLPHMFPRSAQLTFLARFNGDGTAYRYAA